MLTRSQQVRQSQAFSEALAFLRGELKAQRALVLFNDGQGPQAVAAEGIDPETLWTSAPLSLTVLRRCFETGQPTLCQDAQSDPKLADVWSLRVSEIRSLVCAPFWNEEGRVAGLLYADHRGTPDFFDKGKYQALLNHARELEQKLRRSVRDSLTGPRINLQEAERRAEAVARRKAMPAARRAEEGDSDRVYLRPTAQGISVFLRSLATMLKAGLPIVRALSLLSEGKQEDPRMASIARGLARRVSHGRPLSTSMRAFPNCFDVVQVRLVEIGEKTGSLDNILRQLADYQEKQRAGAMKVASAIAYPALMLVLCILMMVFGLPFLLSGQFKMIREFGTEPPLVSRALMAISDLMGQPLVWLLGGLLCGGGLWLLRAGRRNAGVRMRSFAVLDRLPVVGRLLRLSAQSRFSRSLAVCMSAGMTILDAIPLAADAADHPLLIAQAGQARRDISEGAMVAVALRSTGFFRSSFLACLESGEVVGRLDHMLGWVAEMDETELDMALTAFVEMMEPVIMLVMGVLVGILLLGTMLPMVSVLQNL